MRTRECWIVELLHESQYPRMVGLMRKCDPVRLQAAELEFFQRVTNQVALAIAATE